MRITKFVIAASLLSSPSLFAGTSSIAFVQCQDKSGETTIDLRIETDLEEKTAINLMGDISLGVIDANIDHYIKEQRFIAAGGGAYEFVLDKETSFTASNGEFGGNLVLNVNGQALYSSACKFDESATKKLFDL